jgi:tRNA (guanine-N7-)-methyltransferase
MRLRQHVNPNQAHFATFRGERPVLDGRPVELEIREDLVRLVNRRAKMLGTPVRAVFCQAQLHLTEIFPPDTVERVYINFPDPWFKRRHHARRMVDETLAAGVAAVARPGAEMFVQSDVWDIALDAMATFERDDRFVNQAGEWTFWRGGNPYGVRSWREQNAEETGLTIWRILYRRR